MLCDLDEEARFPTDRAQMDSDGDGIADKTEIWSYQFGLGWVPRRADPDGDGLRAEIDPDSDEDGCLDGAEDLNHDGSLYWRAALGWGFKIKSEGETDPFWVDEFKVTLTAERTPLRFKESTRVEVKLTDKDDVPVKDVQVRIRMDPELGSFDSAGGTPVTVVFVLTDKDGKGSAEFFAQETEGTVTLKALCQRNAKDRENKAEVKLQILPYDWIFAVQEMAVLTGPVVTNAYFVKSSTISGIFSAEGWHSHYKDPGYQKVSGHFSHPKSQTPGRTIEQVTVVGIAPGTAVELRIDDTPETDLVWTRTNKLQSPAAWEIRIATKGLETFPRYLEVMAGGQRRRTPLVWWRSGGISGPRQRHVGRVNDEVSEVLRREWVYHSYSFFFGDTADGYDPDYSWPTNVHTKVSFIPDLSLCTIGDAPRPFGAAADIAASDRELALPRRASIQTRKHAPLFFHEVGGFARTAVLNLRAQRW